VIRAARIATRLPLLLATADFVAVDAMGVVFICSS